MKYTIYWCIAFSALDDGLADHLVSLNRVSTRERNQLTVSITTTSPVVDFEGRVFPTTQTIDSFDDGGFGARQSTGDSFDLQKIEDD